jgi:hypothetical protein
VRGEVAVPGDVGQLVRAVEQARSTLLEAVADLRDDQGAFKASPDEWSIAEILEHLFLAELGGITKIWDALNDLRAGRQWSGELPNAGKSIEEVVAATWKPKETAPPVATPHLGGPLAAWTSAQRSLTGSLHDLGRQLDNQRLDAIVFPHFLSGPLDARQRLEFLRFHIERHQQQVGRVRSHPSFPR